MIAGWRTRPKEVGRGMKKGDLRKGIKELIRRRKSIDAAIEDFERLEARIHARGAPRGPNAGAESEALYAVKRKPRARIPASNISKDVPAQGNHE